jgi:hypothetical protein
VKKLEEILSMFQVRMRSKFLTCYDRKKDSWQTLDKKFFIDKMKGKLEVLAANFPSNENSIKQQKMADHCADLANYAMMLAHNYLAKVYDHNGKVKKPEDISGWVKEVVVGSSSSNCLKQFKVLSTFLDTDTGIAHIFIDDKTNYLKKEDN